MKKFLLILFPVLFISCATTNNTNAATEKQQFPWSTTFNQKAGEEIKMPVDCGKIFYGTTTFKEADWDALIPQEFGNKTLVASFPYSYYFNGKKIDVFYEVIIRDIDLKKEIQDLPSYSEIKKDTVIGTASKDNPGIMIRTENGYDPNLILDSEDIPVTVGKYTYFDASTFMPTTAKFLKFQPVKSKAASIEFWDYPETIEQIAAQTRVAPSDDKEHILRLPNFKIMIKTKLPKIPELIRTNSKSDLTLRTQFYSFCTTEETIDFDGIPFHLVFYKNFEKYLTDEYKIGDDIYLYLVFLFGRKGELYFYVRDFTLKSPEQLYDKRLKLISEIHNKKR